MKYETPKEDEWVQPVEDGYKMACCDCGLVHELDFRVRYGRAQFRVRRNNRSTGQIRRWMKDMEDRVDAIDRAARPGRYWRGGPR